MQITITFDPTDEKELANVKAFVDGALGAEALTYSGTDAPVVVQVHDAADEMKADAKADEAAAAKAKKDADAAAAKAKKDADAAAAKAKADEEATAAAAKAKADEEAAKPKFTREEVRQKLKEYAALEGKEAAIKVLKDHGAPSIGELAEDKFDAVMAFCDAS